MSWANHMKKNSAVLERKTHIFVIVTKTSIGSSGNVLTVCKALSLKVKKAVILGVFASTKDSIKNWKKWLTILEPDAIHRI